MLASIIIYFFKVYRKLMLHKLLPNKISWQFSWQTARKGRQELRFQS